jgi:hypothetical protein
VVFSRSFYRASAIRAAVMPCPYNLFLCRHKGHKNHNFMSLWLKKSAERLALKMEKGIISCLNNIFAF